MSARTYFAITVHLIHFSRATSKTVLRVRGLSGVATQCEEIFEAKKWKKEKGTQRCLRKYQEREGVITAKQRKKAANGRELSRQRTIWAKREK